MGAEHEVLVDVVAVGDGAAGMVRWEGEEVKVLIRGDERGEGGEVGVGGEMGLDEGAEGTEWVGWLGVQPERELGEDRRGHIGRLVGRILALEDAQRCRTRQRGIRPERAQCKWDTHLVVVADGERVYFGVLWRIGRRNLYHVLVSDWHVVQAHCSGSVAPRPLPVPASDCHSHHPRPGASPSRNARSFTQTTTTTTMTPSSPPGRSAHVQPTPIFPTLLPPPQTAMTTWM